MSQIHDDPALDLDDRAAADVSALLDGELPPDRLFEAIDALVDSPDCRAFYRRARALDGLIAAAEPSPAEEPPRDVWSRIAEAAGLAGAEATPWGARRSRWIGPLVGTLAATVLVAIVAFGVRNAQRAPQSSARPAPAIAEGDLDAITIGGRRGAMTDQRFLELAEELLGAEQHYRREMAEIILTIESALPSELGSLEPQRTGEGLERSLGREADRSEGGPQPSNLDVRIW